MKTSDNRQQNTAKSHEIVQKIVVAMSTTNSNIYFKINKQRMNIEQQTNTKTIFCRYLSFWLYNIFP